MASTPDALATTIESQVQVETPENVWLSFRPAGPGPRIWAYFIDLCIRFGVLLVLSIVVSLLAPIANISALPMGLMLVGMFLIDWGYGTFFEAFWSGRTPGKKAARIRVIKVGGYPIGFWDAFLRNLLRAADGLPIFYGVGLVVMFSTKRMQRFGDLAAGTFVVHEEREVVRGYPPWVHGVPPIPTNEMSHSYQPSERTLDLIETFLTRAQRLSRARADEIAHILAGPLREKLGYWDPHDEHRQSPGWFLLRVLRTFVYPPTESQPGHHVPLPSLPVPPPAGVAMGPGPRGPGGPPPGAPMAPYGGAPSAPYGGGPSGPAPAYGGQGGPGSYGGATSSAYGASSSQGGPSPAPYGGATPAPYGGPGTAAAPGASGHPPSPTSTPYGGAPPTPPSSAPPKPWGER